MCDTLSSSATNQGDNTVSVAQDGTATLSYRNCYIPIIDYTIKFVKKLN